MNIIYCADPLHKSHVDHSWEIEYLQAKKFGFNIHLIDFEELTANRDVNKAFKSIIKPQTKQVAIYRGWMMPVRMYEVFYNFLLEKNLELINNPMQYKHCYYFPESYDLIQLYTPKTVSISGKPLLSMDKLKAVLNEFAEKPIIIKDYVKSQKHHWDDACYIPNPSDFDNALKIINKFMKLQGDNFQGGLILREYIELEPLGIHPKSKMPLTKEYRLFILNGNLIAINHYWEDQSYSYENVPCHQFNKLYKEIKINFYTMDIAKRKNGDWVIIELGDAQVAEFMGDEGLDSFYGSMAKNSL